MDIQGSEVLALRGMKRLLSDNQNLILVSECWPRAMRDAGTSIDEFFDTLEISGFFWRVIDEDAKHITTMSRDEFKKAFPEDETLINRSYHSGFLSTIVAFGMFGFLAFIAFCLAGFRALYRNYRYGDLELKTANTFLLALFTARFISYFAVYGQFEWDLAAFTGMVGLGISLNRGVASPRQRPSIELKPISSISRRVRPVTAA